MATIATPTVVGALVGSSASQAVIAANLTRQGIYVFNASAVTIWVCPATKQDGTAQAAAVSGAGSISIATQTGVMLGPGNMPHFTAGLNAIAASGSNNPLSLWEFNQ
jgi:hypothetical protein